MQKPPSPYHPLFVSAGLLVCAAPQWRLRWLVSMLCLSGPSWGEQYASFDASIQRVVTTASCALTRHPPPSAFVEQCTGASLPSLSSGPELYSVPAGARTVQKTPSARRNDSERTIMISPIVPRNLPPTTRFVSTLDIRTVTFVALTCSYTDTSRNNATAWWSFWKDFPVTPLAGPLFVLCGKVDGPRVRRVLSQTRSWQLQLQMPAGRSKALLCPSLSAGRWNQNAMAKSGGSD